MSHFLFLTEHNGFVFQQKIKDITLISFIQPANIFANLLSKFIEMN